MIPYGVVGTIFLGGEIIATTIDNLQITASGNARGALASLDRIIQRLERIQQLEGSVNTSFSGMGGNVTSVTNITNNYNRTLNQTNKQLTQHISHHRSLVHRLATTVGQMYILFMAAKKVANIYAEWYKKSNDFIENMNLFEVTMRDNTDAALGYAESVERIMGIDLSDWLSYQGKFQQLSKGFGVASDAANVMSQNLTQLSYDLSSFFNVDVEKAFQKLSSAMAGQVKGLREYGIDVSNASLQQYALSKGIELTVREMNQAQKSVLRYNYILEKSVNIQGDLARTIVTPANALRILNAQLEKLKRTLGNVISVIVTQFIPYVQAGVTIITRFAERIANAFGFEMPKIDYSGLDDAVSVEDDLSEYAEDISDNFADATQEVKKFKNQLMGFDELNILKAPTDDAASKVKTPEIANIYPDDLGLGIPSYDFGLDSVQRKAEEIIESLKKVFDDAYENTGMEDFVEGLNKGMDRVNIGYVKENAEEIVSNAEEIYTKTAPSVINAQKSFGGLLGSFFSIPLTVTGKSMEFLTGGINKWLKKDKGYIIDTIIEITGNLGKGFENLTPIFDDVGDKIGKIFDLFRPFFEGTVGTVLSTLTHYLGEIGKAGAWLFGESAEGMKEVYFWLVEDLPESIYTAITQIGKFFSDTWSGMSDFFSSVWENVSVFFASAWENVSGFFSSVGEWFSGLWDSLVKGWHTVFDPWIEIIKRASVLIKLEVIDPIVKFFEEMWQNISGFFQSLWENVSGFFSSLWSDIVGIWDEASNWFNTNVINPVKGFFEELWGGTTEKAGKAWEGIQGVFSNVAEFFSNTFSTAWKKVQEIFSSGGKIFEGIKEGVSRAFTGVVNSLIDGLNNIVGNTFYGLNNALDFIHNVEILGVKPFSYINRVEVPQIPKIPTYAQGGFPETGEMFIARESGAEMVGTIGNHTAVANNDQIVTAIEAAVFRAMSQLRNNNTITVNATMEVDGEAMAHKTFTVHNDEVLRTGASPLLI